MSNNNNKLSLNSAMETLQSMFPDFDQETIKKTLYKTNGHMERTIEHLLNLQESNMNHHNYDTTSSPMSPHIPSPATTTTTTATSTVRTTSTSSSSTKLRHNLPSSFLRYNDINDDDYDDDEHGSTTHNNSRGSSISNKSQLQEMNDEAYARELQRKMMMEEAFHRTPNTPSSRTSTTTTTTTNTTSAAQKVQGAKTTKESMRGFGVNNRPVSSSFSDRMRRRLADFKDKITSRDQQQAQNKTRNRGDDDEDLWDQEDNL